MHFDKIDESDSENIEQNEEEESEDSEKKTNENEVKENSDKTKSNSESLKSTLKKTVKQEKVNEGKKRLFPAFKVEHNERTGFSRLYDIQLSDRAFTFIIVRE